MALVVLQCPWLPLAALGGAQGCSLLCQDLAVPPASAWSLVFLWGGRQTPFPTLGQVKVGDALTVLLAERGLQAVPALPLGEAKLA